jgi:hypothetical protein
LNDIERDGYSLMEPKFKEEIQATKSEIEGVMRNGNELQQIFKVWFYSNHKPQGLLPKSRNSLVNFPENLIIENGKCRTSRENQVILDLMGFDEDF